jgi:hypothetical protein
MEFVIGLMSIFVISSTVEKKFDFVKLKLFLKVGLIWYICSDELT